MAFLLTERHRRNVLNVGVNVRFWPIADAGVLVQLRRGTNEVLLES